MIGTLWRIAAIDCGNYGDRMSAPLTTNGLKGEKGGNVEANTSKPVSYNLNHYRLIWDEKEV